MVIKKNDVVVVITGDDQGKTGPVIDILHKKGKVKVQNIALAKRHARKRVAGGRSEIRTQERWIDLSNVKKL